ncbi:NAD-dependent epimerase/dehydratase family protein [Pedobacter panaciterrae]|jgi:UDP-glucose 4-epimerase|uniref:NAD-dependent epimerase/dehydratase family protein n=1 Tax=Pedobacter panaciterrae TaxID=363849 RepID=UPI00155DC78B|nr:NAD-dependent epimerase/dehydratase family protein [Pedobacter panaciterrae]NQX55242.1 NAD-dependent epimerase/dehydratase family protein [Pedobacter panaciterrae]
MKILVTGAYGFLGRHTAKKFKQEGHYVTGMGHGKWYSDEFSKWGIDNWVESTITFETLINTNQKFDLIVHCAGSGSVAFSRENPYEDFQKSVQSTLSLLEYIRLQNPACKFIYPSSPAVQGDLGNTPISEDMLAVPVSPYGFHKKIAEELCRSYYNNFNIEVGIIRYFSIYGEGLKKQLLWDACRKIQNSDTVTFFGTGNETRDWIHVSDAVNLLYRLAMNLEGYQVFNGGSGESVEINQVIKGLCESFNKPVRINFNGEVKVGDPIHFWADISKALSLDWRPTIKLSDGLKNYVEYYKSLNND